MEKKSFNIESEDLVILRFQKQEIQVNPYISVSLQKALMNYYMEAMSLDGKIEDKFIEAEQTVMLAMIDNLTNIEIEGMDLDVIITSGLWNQIRSCIINYEDFRIDLESALKMMRENDAIRNSVDSMIAALVLDIRGLIEKFATVDLSEEGVSKILKALNTEKDEINKIINPSVVPATKKKTKKEILQ